MTLQDFINQNNGKGLDFDGAYGNQCVDLVQFWSQNLGGPRFTGNAEDMVGQTGGFYSWVDNTPDGVPTPGDILVWDTRIGAYGHTAVFVDGDANSFDSFDQNWNYHPYCEMVHHTYYGVAGWLHAPQVPQATNNQGDETMSPDQEKQAYEIVLGREPEAGAVLGQRTAFDFIVAAQAELTVQRQATEQTVANLNQQVADLQTQVKALQNQSLPKPSLDDYTFGQLLSVAFKKLFNLR